MVVFLGPTGAGKSVQAKLLAKAINCRLLSTGEFLRQSHNRKYQQAMMNGHLLDDKTVISIADNMIKDLPTGTEAVFDGFPRTLKQTEWLVQQQKSGRLKLSAAVHLLVSQEVAKARLLARARPDDHLAAIDQRFMKYQHSVGEILKLLQTSSVPVFEIMAEGDVKSIHSSIAQHIKRLISIQQ